ncbi:TetR/AcrR family transcriptional regulator [Fusibacter sp. JL216-2]|uniref:TetR/AcrR family transcriptional regulator n=1 Tax=Fusibacter sp. JL216-2 TaxID=3071453 RepID=UPI003D356472
MPKKTFLNLPNEKRERIENAAIEEFATYTFRDASINRIISSVGIAKGSFYQYFNDKKDLYKHIVDLSGMLKMSYLTSKLSEMQGAEFFDILEAFYITGIEFSKKYTKLSKIGDDLVKGGDRAFREEILGDSLKKSNEFIEGLLMHGMKQGSINPEINISMISYLITTFSVNLNEYYIMSGANDENAMTLIKEMLNLLRNGIEVKE